MRSRVEAIRSDGLIAARPVDVHILLVDALNAGDVESAMALWEFNATLVLGPKRRVTGSTAIRRTVETFVARKRSLDDFDLSISDYAVIEADDVARVESTWTTFFFTDDDYAVNHVGTTADVVRRQEDGSWRLVIADWWGR